MTGVSVETALELWASSLRDVKGRIRPLFQQDRMAASAGLFLDALLVLSGARRAGCVRKPRAIPGRGASRLCSVGRSGRPMRFAMWCAIT